MGDRPSPTQGADRGPSGLSPPMALPGPPRDAHPCPCCHEHDLTQPFSSKLQLEGRSLLQDGHRHHGALGQS